jgi:hypothetical protein
MNNYSRIKKETLGGLLHKKRSLAGLTGLIVFVIADVSCECLLAAVACGSQNLVAWNVPQCVDGGE